MALFQIQKAVLLTLTVILCVKGVLQLVQGCHPNSKELHICLNIYLEKYFPFIETIVTGRKRGRVLLEDTDLENICWHVSTLHDCYKNLLKECDTYWQLDRYSRLMHVMQASHAYLCSNTTNALRDLLLNSGCLTRAEDHIANCSDFGFSWLTTWKEILRMQVSPADRCRSMDEYRNCLTSKLQDVICGEEAAKVYENLINVWLQSWCSKNPSQSSGMEYLFQPMTFVIH